MQLLKQSTQVKVRIGPFMDATDAVTPETGVALGTADQAEALKADGAATVDISGAAWTAVTGCSGWYDLTLTTSLTDTVGTLDIIVQDASLCLPVFARFQVIEEAVFDALYAASAPAPYDGSDTSGVTTLLARLTAARGGYLDNLNGHTAQTGDSFARLGAPSGASVSADVLSVINDLANGTDGLGALKAVLDNILVDTGTSLPATLSTIAGYIDTEITTIITNIGNLNDVSSADVLAQVNAALDTAIAELGVAVPTSTPTMRSGLMLLYMMARNQFKTQTSGTDAIEVYNDAGTMITKKVITDDGSDYTEAKMS